MLFEAVRWRFASKAGPTKLQRTRLSVAFDPATLTMRREAASLGSAMQGARIVSSTLQTL